MDNPDFSYLQNRGYNITNQQFQNLLAFLAIMQGESVMSLLTTSPDYICEKFWRYIGPVEGIKDTDDHEWGIHPSLRSSFINAYYAQWGSMLNWTLSQKLDVL